MCPTNTAAGADNPAWKGGISRQWVRYADADKKRHPERWAARKAVAAALSSGKLTRLRICSHCLAVGIRSEFHHWKSYRPEHWLDVIELCRACHILADLLLDAFPYATTPTADTAIGRAA